MKLKESETIEFKTSTAELKEAVISISAILNKQGKGKLYFGIKDDGSIVGQMVGKSTLTDIAEAISTRLEPKIFPTVRMKKNPRQTVCSSYLPRNPSSLFCLWQGLYESRRIG